MATLQFALAAPVLLRITLFALLATLLVLILRRCKLRFKHGIRRRLLASDTARSHERETRSETRIGMDDRRGGQGTKQSGRGIHVEPARSSSRFVELTAPHGEQ